VLLDVDGTLLDTTEFILAAFERAFRQHARPCPAREELRAQVGRPLEGIYAGYCGDLAAAMVECHRSFQEANLALARPFPGAAAALTRLRDAGLQLAAVTSRSRRTSVKTLELAGLAGFFDVIISAEDCPALKPDPAPFLLALRALGQVGDRAAVVGDTPADILAGRAIGALTVAALYGFHGRALLAANPDAAIESVSDLPAALGVPAWGELSAGSSG
jgi:HAD superfamily hydrolase (TIGR01509 family)